MPSFTVASICSLTALSPAQPVAISRSARKISLQKGNTSGKWLLLKPDVPNYPKPPDGSPDTGHSNREKATLHATQARPAVSSFPAMV
jgi:hypothetical protein